MGYKVGVRDSINHIVHQAIGQEKHKDQLNRISKARYRFAKNSEAYKASVEFNKKHGLNPKAYRTRPGGRAFAIVKAMNSEGSCTRRKVTLPKLKFMGEND